MLAFKILSFTIIALGGISIAYGSTPAPETEAPEKDEAARARNILLTEKLEARPDVKDALKRLEIRIQSLFWDGKQMCDLVPMRGPYLDEAGDLKVAFSTGVTSLIPDTETELKKAIVAVRDCYELIARACTAIGNNHKVTKEETAMCIRKFEILSLKTAESTQLQNRTLCKTSSQDLKRW
jgi:hypothetical protein